MQARWTTDGRRVSKRAFRAACRAALTVMLLLTAALMAFPAVWTCIHVWFSPLEIETNYGAVLDETRSGYANFKLVPDMASLDAVLELLVYKPTFLRLFWNSVLLAVPIAAGQTAVASLAAYAFAKLAFRGREALFLAYVLTMLMPFQVLMVPHYIVSEALGLTGGWGAIVWPGIFGAFGVFLLRQFMVQIPDEYAEAAQMDGAGRLTIVVRIMLPLVRPGIASLLMLLFIDQWNMVEQPLLFLDDPFEQPLSLYLSRVQAEDPGLAFAASVLYMTPLLLIFLYGENDLVEGIRTAGLKG